MKLDVEGAHALIATAGGLARYLFSWGKRPPGTPFPWGQAIALGLASGFAGVMASSFATLLGYSTWAPFVAGVGGFMGVRTMELIFMFFEAQKPGSQK